MTNISETLPVHQKENRNHDNLIRDQKKELQKLQRQFQKLEEEIANLNQQKTQIETELAHPESYKIANKFAELEKAYISIQQQSKLANQQYEILFDKILELENGG